MIKAVLKACFLQAFFLLITTGIIKAQNFSGVWYGTSPITKTAGYHLSSTEPNGELFSIQVVENNQITGYSYSYYWFRGDFYYYISSLKGSLNPLTKKLEFRADLTEEHLFYAHYYCPKNYSITFNTKNRNEFLSGTWTSDSFANCGSGTGNFSRKKPVFPPGFNTAPFDTLFKRFMDENALREKKELVVNSIDTIKTIPAVSSSADVSKRANTFMKTIAIHSPDIKIEVLDNGAIDNDTVSVYFNKSLLLNKVRISKQAITLQLKATVNGENELVMYADNLGDVPPNTAEMRVYADGKKYTLQISSDEKKNGAIRFEFIKER